MSANDLATLSFSVEDQVLAEQVGDELILLDLRSERYLSVDAVGARVWALLAQGHTVGEITEILGREYDAPRDVLVRDVGQFTDKVVELGLVRPMSI